MRKRVCVSCERDLITQTPVYVLYPRKGWRVRHLENILLNLSRSFHRNKLVSVLNLPLSSFDPLPYADA